MPGSNTDQVDYLKCQWFLIFATYNTMNKCLKSGIFFLEQNSRYCKCVHTFWELLVSEENSNKGTKQSLTVLTHFQSVIWALSLKFSILKVCIYGNGKKKSTYKMAEVRWCAGELLLTWHKLETDGKREPGLRTCHTGLCLCLWAFSWFPIDGGSSSSLWLVPPLGRWSWVV